MTNPYSFDILKQKDPANIQQQLQNRPLKTNRLEHNADRYQPDEALKAAINTAIALGEPLLLTGEPGTGKTQAAYYIAHTLGLGKVLHFQVKSDTTAQALLYHFDTLRYFHDAQDKSGKTLNKKDYLEKGHLWTAFESKTPRVVLIDEIDKAPRDFPNDLLHELDEMAFDIREVIKETTNEQGETVHAPLRITANDRAHPIVIITSNSEHRLPDAFLRRCVFNHIKYDPKRLRLIVEQHKSDFATLAKHPDIIDLAIERFNTLQSQQLRKSASTSELIIWLRVLSMAVDAKTCNIDDLIKHLRDKTKWPPYMQQTLIKTQEDLAKLDNPQRQF